MGAAGPQKPPPPTDMSLLAPGRMSAGGQDDPTDELLAKIQSFQTESLQKTQAYNNVVVSLGYAGMFAIWQFVAEDMPPRDNALVAVLFGLSLLGFVLWILITSIGGQLRAVAAVKELMDPHTSNHTKLALMKRHEDNVRSKHARVLITWQLLFGFAVLTGLAAGAAILSLSFAILVDVEFSIVDLAASLFGDSS